METRPRRTRQAAVPSFGAAKGRLLPFGLLLAASVILGVTYAHAADAACKPIKNPKFAHVPMRVAVLFDVRDAELSSTVSDINGHQDFYRLIILPKNDPFANVAISLDYDAMLVLDEKMMSGGAPKYNRYLHTYRDRDLSDQTMVIDYPFNSEGRIGFTFMQIAAANSEARSLLMELGLMALADFTLMTDAEFRDYYEKVDRIVQFRDDQLDPVALGEISKIRENVIIKCFLRANRDPG